jgi:L-fucose isomerase-like protein
MIHGVVAIARPTFDVPFAEETAATAFATLERAGLTLVGSAELKMDEDAVRAAVAAVVAEGADALVVIQATFADSSLAVAATESDLPVTLWAVPEGRTGGRLRLNSFCGINLAAFTLTNLGRDYRWVLAPADDAGVAASMGSADADAVGRPAVGEIPSVPDDDARRRARTVAERLRATTIGRVGERPGGFEPCGYEAGALRDILGVTVDEVELPELFARSAAAPVDAVAAARSRASRFLAGVDEVDQESLDQSLRMNAGLRSLIDEGGWSGVATRCWPETFTEFGAAACTPMAMLTEDHTPGSCEADVYGNITGLVLSWLGGSASFVADLVDLDVDESTNTGVVWHCGLAPFEMADPESTPVATIHSNRRKPLLSEFPLKPGRVTIARFSQSRGQHRLMIGGGEMLRRPLPFSGTAGVVRFDSPVGEVLHTIMAEGLEHHYGLVYADVRAELRALAAELEIPVIEL